MQDGLEQVGVAAFGNRLEEAAADDLEPVGVGAGDDGRLVEQHAAHARMAGQDPGQQRAVSAADIDDHAVAAEVVRDGHRGVDAA